PRGLQYRPQIILDKVPFLLRRIYTGFPCLFGHGFVLHRQTPDRDALCLVCLDELYIEVGPAAAIFLLLEMASMQDIVIVLHPCGRAPGRNKEPQTAARRCDSLLDKWD